jgi:diaminopimelate epimerase
VRLRKYHGLGNDFLVLLDVEEQQPIDRDLARAVCHRHRGPGADGLIRVTAGRDGADVSMELRNADGSRAETSGNGLRCLARAVVDAGILAGPTMVIATDAGPRRASLGDGGLVAVEMGVAKVEPLPPGSSPPGVAVDLGNPHLVLLDERRPAWPERSDRPAWPERSDRPAWPERSDRPAWPDHGDDGTDLAALGRSHPTTNVELIAPGPGPGELTMRVWERGVGETQACGSGACAAVAAAAGWGLVGEQAVVHQPGGDVVVDLAGETIVLTGPVEFVCTVEVPDPGRTERP